MDKQTQAYQDALASAKTLRGAWNGVGASESKALVAVLGAQINNELAVIAASVLTLREWGTEEYAASGTRDAA